ncbi:MAG: Branched-chain amino acid ABC transporter, amino acid-binding protein [uncultured Frankineae bacterium]|uniref:Branched-chain amino acid ABC transporter, amino acid-binding protein n=1 Tax=uncultured Frankineae bacterium TaxID=437475 RepID=A0A6J4KUE7_9ACTN|nr:MAG: Branched-chain amino acid ABC transporter, amino acid-binding protein [uncultured Frankineae bacterium]
MNSPVRTWRMLAAISAGALALAACGGGDDGGDTATEASAAPSESAASEKQNTADGTLTIGTLLPQTGSLAFLGPPEFAGVDLAIKEINEAGGILGKPVAKIDSDSGDTATNIASQSVDRLLSQNVDVIVGAASSGVSKTVIDTITGAGVVQISPANTSPDFTDYPDKGLYFRTAPSDVLQGRILGDQIIEDGSATVGILALQDAYGTGLAENVTKSIEGSNGEVVEEIIYDPKAAEFTAEVSQIKGADPEAIVVIGFDESAKIIQELAKQGIGPQDGKKLYLVDGNTGNALGEKLPAGLLKGVKGTVPGAAAGPEFQARLKSVDPALKDFSYSAESYDAVNVVALAAVAAESDAGTDIAEQLVDVTTGGTKCSTFSECNELATAGTDFDYDGVSGPIEFDENGDPTEASVGVYEYDQANKIPATAQNYKSGKL